jgi:hypothetical protein
MAGASLSDLLTEFYGRGYDDLQQDAVGQARATRWINQADGELTLEEPWPFRLSTASGAAPLTIADLDEVLSVTLDEDRTELVEMTERELTGYDLEATGTAVYFYRDDLTVRVWPVSTATVDVRYYRLPVELVAPADTSMIPEQYMNAIVDRAVMAAGANRDNPAVVELADRMYQRTLSLMRRRLLVAPTHIQRNAANHLDG